MESLFWLKPILSLAEVPAGFTLDLFLEVVDNPFFNFAGDVKGGFHQLTFVLDQSFLFGNECDFGSRHHTNANPQAG